MITLSRHVRMLAALTAGLCSAQLAVGATTFLWNQPTPGANNWSTTSNWSPSGSPGTADTAVFGDIGTSASASTVNNIVDAATTLTALTYTNTTSGQYHVTQIPTGNTLTVSGTVTVGGITADSITEYVSMVDGGTFVATGNTFSIGNIGVSGVVNTTLDLSSLSNFVYKATAGTFGLGSANRSSGTLRLAATSNNITAGTANLITGSTSSSGSGNVYLGSGTNILNVGTLNLSAGRLNGTLSFPGSTGGLRWRGTGGTDTDRSTITIGNRSTGGSSGTTTGTLDFNGHPVDVKLGTATIGKCTGTTPVVGTGILRFDQGTIDVTSLVLAVESSTGTANGTVTVGAAGALVVGTGGISLANQSSTGTGAGTLNINGTVACSGNIVKTTTSGSTGTVSLGGGTLTMVNAANTVGTLSVPIDAFNPTSATLHFALDGSAAATRTNIVAATVNAGGITTISIDSIANVTGTVTFHIARATSAFNGGVGNFVVANPLPGGRIGVLSLNNNLLDLTVIPAGGTGRTLTWDGTPSGSWDLSTLNWKTNGVSTAYQQTDAVVLDDSLTGTRMLSLTANTTLIPLSITVNNSGGDYLFGDNGLLGGTGGLIKQGSSALILDNSQPNTFTGGVTISGGTLQVGNNDANGYLPAGSPVTNNAALVFDRTDNVTASNTISGSGTVTQSGTGTLTLSGNNSSSGGTFVNAGALALNGTLGGSLTSAAGTALAGSGTCTGLVSVAGLLLPGNTNVPGTLTASGGLTLQFGSTLTFDLASSTTIGAGVNDLIQVNGNLTANNSTISINLLSSPQAGSPYRLMNYTGNQIGSLNPAVTVLGGTHFTPTLDQSTPNQVNLTFTGSGATLVWLGSSGSTWDVGSTANWSNEVSSVSPDFFYQGDTVVLDDTAGVPTTITLGSVVAPTLVQNNSSANSFVLGTSSDPGRISGSANITKNGSSVLILGTSNDFTGTVSINGGTVQLASRSALGSTNGGTTIASGATLDLAANNVLGEPLTASGFGVAGQGAIVNSAGTLNPAVNRLVLVADTALGGPGVQGLGGNLAGRWDIRATSSGAADPATSTLSTGGHPYKLNKVGPNYTAICNTTIDPALAEIDIQGGTLSFQYNVTCLGDATKTLTVETGASLDFYNLTNQANKVFVLNGDGTTTTINNNLGANTLIGPMTFNDSAICGVSGTSLTLNGAIGGSGTLTKTGTSPLYLGGPITYSGGITVQAGKLVLNNQNSGGGTLTGQATTTIAGNGTNSGLVDISGSLLPGDANAFGSFGAGTLTFEGGATVTFDIGTDNTIGSGNNDLVQVTGDLNLNTTPILINVLHAPPQLGTYRLINYGGSLNGSFDTSNVTNYLHYNFALDTSTPHQVNLVVSGGPALMLWNSTSDTTWNMGGTANWSNTVNHVSPDFFYNGDGVFLGDLPGVVSAINLTAAVSPASFTNNSTTNYTISGPGKLSGTVGLDKQGSGILALGTTNDFTGASFIEAGTVQVLNSGSLGAASGPVTISPGATLDVLGPLANNALNLGAKLVTVSGAGVGGLGAIVNSGTNTQQNALQQVTLAGDTTFGGPGPWSIAGTDTGRWDIRGTGCALSTSGNAYNLTKVGNNHVALVGANVDTHLADIDIQDGILSFETTTTSMGNPANNLTVRLGAMLAFYNTTNQWNKNFIFNGDGVRTNIYDWNGSNTIIGPMTLNGGCVVATPGGSLALYGPVGGSGGFTKLVNNTLYLYGANTCTGPTIVSAGTLALAGNAGLSNSVSLTVASGATLDASTRTDLKLNLTSGQTLSGFGTVNPNLVTTPGSTLEPGSSTSIGTLTVSSVANLQGTTLIKIDKSQAQTSDRLVASGGLIPGGTLQVTNANPGLPLAGGDVFTVFTAGFWFAGSFTLSPASPGPGLAWDTSTLTSDGKLRVVATVNPNPGYITNSLSGNQLTLSWSADRTGWSLQTNAVSLANTSAWFRVTGSANTNVVTILINPASPQVFFRMVYP